MTPALEGLLRGPIIVAPMGGGPSTPDLVVAAAEARAVGFLAAAYKDAAAVEADVRAVRARSSEPFGINLFVPGRPSRNRRKLDRYLKELETEAMSLGVALGEATWDDDRWTEKTELVVDIAPALCSFTFGIPPARLVDALKRRGTRVVVTVTSVDEAMRAAQAQADALCLQGIEAGGHRGSFDDVAGRDAQLGSLDLLAQVRRSIDLPLIVAGGIARPEDVRRAQRAGATAVQAGTAFLRSAESAAHPAYKAALVDPRYSETALTRAFSGRRARGLVNRFARHHPDAPRAFPEINNATRPLRTAAAERSDPEGMSLWAGTGYQEARGGSTASIIDWLSEDL